jgi:hypothetical protein
VMQRRDVMDLCFLGRSQANGVVGRGLHRHRDLELNPQAVLCRTQGTEPALVVPASERGGTVGWGQILRSTCLSGATSKVARICVGLG